MKKEKTIRTYQRKTKSGKITTVKSHTAKYDAAAEVAKKAARKKGAGGELQAKLTKMPDPKLELEQYLDELKKSRSGASSDTAKTTKPAPKKKLKKPVGGGITGLEPRETKKAPAKKQTKPAPKSSDTFSDLKGLHRVLKYNEFKDDEPKSLTGTQRNSALKILKANGYKKVADYWVPPKGKGNTYTDYKGSLFQTDSDSKRDLYSGHTFLGSSQYKTLTELGYKEPNKKITTKSKTPKLKGVGPLSTGKVMRSKADIPAKLAKSYATFEDIPLKQAYDELMVASKKDYRRTVAFHKGHY